MTDHPITPPLELMQQWTNEIYCAPDGVDQFVTPEDRAQYARAAQWGYEQRGKNNEAKLQQARDQELEACTAWLRHEYGHCLELADKLRAARRPKPPSLKEQALKLLETYGTSGVKLTAEQCNTIRCALEALPND